MELKGMSMSELIEIYNALATDKGVPPQTEFKNLAAARAAINELEGNEIDPIMDSEEAVINGADNKYSTVGKRGPNQGVGEYAKNLLAQGMSTTDVLEQVRENFPTAKTSASCIAYYKAALKNPLLGKKKASLDPAALRAKARELLAQADAAENMSVEQAQRAAEEAQEKAKLALEALECAKVAAAAKQAAQEQPQQ